MGEGSSGFQERSGVCLFRPAGDTGSLLGLPGSVCVATCPVAPPLCLCCSQSEQHTGRKGTSLCQLANQNARLPLWDESFIGLVIVSPTHQLPCFSSSVPRHGDECQTDT